MIMSFFQGLWNNLHEMSTEDAIEGTMKLTLTTIKAGILFGSPGVQFKQCH